jgi:hypothetical protein
LNAGVVNFLFGCAGGAGVNVYRLYEASKLRPEVRPPFDLLYFGQAILLSALGGVWVLANHLTTPISPMAAISIGASVPALIKTGADARAKKRKSSPRIG